MINDVSFQWDRDIDWDRDKDRDMRTKTWILDRRTGQGH